MEFFPPLDDEIPGIGGEQISREPPKITLTKERRIAEKLPNSGAPTENYYTDYIMGIDRSIEGDIVWQNTHDPKSFARKEEVSFLRITNDTIMLDIFEFDCHMPRHINISPEVAAEIKSYLTQHPFIDWDIISSGWENSANKDTPSGVFTFLKEKHVSTTHKLVWTGKHINPATPRVPGRIQDTLSFQPITGG